MRLRKKAASILCICILAAAGIAVTVCAKSSISDLHDNQEVTVEKDSTDGTNTASLLSQAGVYTNQAISDQYKKKDANGNLIPTDLSNLIDSASSVALETGENGASIVEPIPTVTELLTHISQKTSDEYDKEYGYNPDHLDQITYMMDFKYTGTDYRVVPGERVTVKNKTEILDNGMIRAFVKGDEILRSASKEDFVIIQVDPVTQKINFFKMKEYDEETGNYIADFPCVGPYMITQIMKR